MDVGFASVRVAIAEVQRQISLAFPSADITSSPPPPQPSPATPLFVVSSPNTQHKQLLHLTVFPTHSPIPAETEPIGVQTTTTIAISQLKKLLHAVADNQFDTLPTAPSPIPISSLFMGPQPPQPTIFPAPPPQAPPITLLPLFLLYYDEPIPPHDALHNNFTNWAQPFSTNIYSPCFHFLTQELEDKLIAGVLAFIPFPLEPLRPPNRLICRRRVDAATDISPTRHVFCSCTALTMLLLRTRGFVPPIPTGAPPTSCWSLPEFAEAGDLTIVAAVGDFALLQNIPTTIFCGLGLVEKDFGLGVIHWAVTSSLLGLRNDFKASLRSWVHFCISK
ncbi:hypothetical protein Salat_2668500 [Sesamum alatum]|uniref:Uncharacterized protein n=1 Tax=Sesamum alatum TaxID=300844 RepID=A0AAE2CB44_9LAMI|nr:hypothetical protein Salat_2668500 [Sesamum alatum]